MASKKKIVKKKVNKKKAAKKKVTKKKTVTKKKKVIKKSKTKVYKLKNKVNANNMLVTSVINKTTGSDFVTGRSRIIETPEEMDLRIDNYILSCLDKNEPLTLTGMILFIGLSSRESFDHYAKEHEGFSDSVKRGKLIIQYGYEIRLHGTTPTGSIFALKNFGWFDKTPESQDDEVPESVNISFSVTPAVGDVRITKGKKK